MSVPKFMQTCDEDSSSQILAYINDNIIGKNRLISTPFGRRQLLYCDYTASGRALKFIEEYILEKVLPNYGNTHTTATATAAQTTVYREDARNIVRQAVNASDDDVVIFSGSGSTGAIQVLLHAYQFEKAPVVFVSLFEHHSNLLPWRETAFKVIVIQETSKGRLNIKHLEHELKKWRRAGRPLIGSFVAASNITGSLSDTIKVSEVLHRYGAVSFWDYATAAPYVDINMNPEIDGCDPKLICKDAVFISMHKFVGGVQTPGVLIAKKKLFQCHIPHAAGGGTVAFVTKEDHHYTPSVEAREEGGTPAIVESIRAGLVMQLKMSVGPQAIETREHDIVRKAFAKFSQIPNLFVLGPAEDVSRLPVFSFLIRHESSGLFLHYNFVGALLNDLFGIQIRGGCMCAGPYGAALLGISDELAKRYASFYIQGFSGAMVGHGHANRYEIWKPGYSRLSLAYFMSEDELEYIFEAITIIAMDGWAILPLYSLDAITGEWKHVKDASNFTPRSLADISYERSPRFAMITNRPDSAKSVGAVDQSSLKRRYLREARALIENAKNQHAQMESVSPSAEEEPILEVGKAMRWFLLPSEAQRWLSVSKEVSPMKPPFQPVVYPKPVKQKLTRPIETFDCNCSDASSSFKGNTKHLKLPSIGAHHSVNSQRSLPLPNFYQRSPDALADASDDAGRRGLFLVDKLNILPKISPVRGRHAPPSWKI